VLRPPPSNHGFGKHNFGDTASGGHGRGPDRLFLDANLPIEQTTAQALYTASLTDTGQSASPPVGAVFHLALARWPATPSPALRAELYERESSAS